MCDKWENPYNSQNRTLKRFSHKKKGVYLIRHKFTKEILYIGVSNYSVYKALYRHFNKWDDHYCRVVFDKNICEVRVIIDLDNPYKVEKRLIRYFQPKMNHEMYEVDLGEYEKVLEECPF